MTVTLKAVAADCAECRFLSTRECNRQIDNRTYMDREADFPYQLLNDNSDDELRSKFRKKQFILIQLKLYSSDVTAIARAVN